MNTDTNALSPLRMARREKILTVAEGLFARHGFRAVTMEGVAEAVSMSKATVYGYFRNKNALFEAVATGVAIRLNTAVIGALADSKGLLSSRIAAALIAKHALVWDLVRQSPFASELFAAQSDHAADIFKTIDEDIEDRIAKALIDVGAQDARSKARVIFGAANGIANRAETNSQMEKDVGSFVAHFLHADDFDPERER